MPGFETATDWIREGHRWEDCTTVIDTIILPWSYCSMTRRERLTVTVDPALIRAGQDAVAAGRAESVSAWVNLALAEHAAKERQLAAMADAMAAYEAKFGAISAEELSAQARADRESAIVVRGQRRAAGHGRPRHRVA